MRVHVRVAVACLMATFMSPCVNVGEPSAASAATLPSYTTTDNPGGGQIVAGSLGKEPSLHAAAVAMLQRIHHVLGTRPTVVKAAQNVSAHSVALFFTGTRNGQRYTGMSVVTAAPGSDATGAAMYDTTARFPKTIGPMLRRLGTMTNSTPGAAAGRKIPAVHLAPAQALIQHQFSDGTGTIGVPATWMLRGAGGGSAVAVGPTGKEIANYHFTQPALDPSYGMGQDLIRGAGMYANPQMRQMTLQHEVLLPYSADAVQAWSTSFSAMAKQKGFANGPTFVIKNRTPMGADGAYISGTGNAPEPITYFAYVAVSQPNRMGQWSMQFSYVIVPTAEVLEQGATAAAVLNSVRINNAALNSQLDTMRAAFQKQFEAQIASDQAADIVRQQGTDNAIAADRVNSDEMRKQAVAMANFSLDRSVVTNRLGEHVTVGNELASALVQGNPHYAIVPANELVGGMDY